MSLILKLIQVDEQLFYTFSYKIEAHTNVAK